MPRPTASLDGAWTAIVTPFTPDGTGVDVDRLRQQVAFQLDGGVRGIVPCGTTGEAPTLSEVEQDLVISTSVECACGTGCLVVAGAGSNATAHALHRQRRAKELGADGGLQVSPYYNKPSQEGLYRHFMTVADGCDLPIVLYNIPGRCAVTMTPDTVERLARHPNIVAIKEATGSMDSASEIRRRCGITILSGDDSLTLSFAAVGATGVVSVVSNLMPRAIADLCDGCARNDFAAARQVHESIFPLSRGLLSLDTNPAPLKAAMALLGRDSGALRLPMHPVDPTLIPRIQSLLVESGLMSANTGGPGRRTVIEAVQAKGAMA
ncbi:MAG: 4-hydroxy-tetrahydrodipicolinate synthase [Planctomycetota bacterium]|nr:4-hydroxy-tetrahydrodipicolinate synthase [Planctomycetota bacterium]MDA1105614.1 4-hydroxy-tetrahydrodipicolinate synthase [Planctomycetota bacterium]